MTQPLQLPTPSVLNQFIQDHFPQAPVEVLEVAPMYAKVRLKITDKALRPGGTVSGPALFTLADTALYMAILATIGLVPMALTTNLNINFLSKASPDHAVVADCKLLKVGKSLAIGEVSIHSEGTDKLVAHATGTYSIPPDRATLA